MDFSIKRKFDFQVTFDGGENVVDFIRMPIEHIEQGVIEASTDWEDRQLRLKSFEVKWEEHFPAQITFVNGNPKWN